MLFKPIQPRLRHSRNWPLSVPGAHEGHGDGVNEQGGVGRGQAALDWRGDLALEPGGPRLKCQRHHNQLCDQGLEVKRVGHRLLGTDSDFAPCWLSDLGR